MSKTSLSANIAGLAGAAGHRVLLVDLDPQGDLKDDLGYLNHGQVDHGQGLAGAMLPGTRISNVMKDVRPNLLATSLLSIAGAYDLIVIDTPREDRFSQHVRAFSLHDALARPTSSVDRG